MYIVKIALFKYKGHKIEGKEHFTIEAKRDQENILFEGTAEQCEQYCIDTPEYTLFRSRTTIGLNQMDQYQIDKISHYSQPVKGYFDALQIAKELGYEDSEAPIIIP